MAIQNSQLERIGNSLAGFSAGLQGQLPQYMQLQQNQQAQQQEMQERQQKMLLEREKAAYRDAYAAQQLAEQGNYEAVVKLGMNRLQMLRQIPGADPSDTQRLTKMAIEANKRTPGFAERLKSELDSIVAGGIATGNIVIEKPKVISGSDISDTGQIVTMGADGRPQAVNVEGFKPDGSNLGIVQVFAKDGTARSILTDDKGNFFDVRGRAVQLDPEDRIIEGSSLTGGQDDLGIGNTEATKLRDAQVATTNFMGSVGDALEMLEANPDINTFVGRAASIVNDLQQEAKAIARQFDVDFDESILSPQSHSETFDKLGVRNAQMRSIITSLAYNQALANNPDGRISNADLDRAIQEIGGSAADPKAFKTTLLDVASRVDRNFRNNYRIRMQKDFEGDLGVERLSKFGAPSSGELTSEERAELEALRAKYGR